jgi:uncharacterized protein
MFPLSERQSRLPRACSSSANFQQCLNQPPNQAMSVSSAVTKNATTESPWPISSSTRKIQQPQSTRLQFENPALATGSSQHGCPVFFPPEVLLWYRSDPSKTFVFVDGGIRPHNNPTFLLYRTATKQPMG